MVELLPLESDLWDIYDKRQGENTDFYLPAMLLKLETAKGKEFFDALSDIMFEKLSHQGSIYAPAYAAFPHMVRIFQNRMQENEAVDLAAMISYLVAYYKGSNIPDNKELMDEFYSSLEIMRNIIGSYIRKHCNEWDSQVKFQMMMAYLALKNQEEETAYIFDLGISGGIEELEIEGCPRCNEYHNINLDDMSCMLSDEKGALLLNATYKINIQPGNLSELKGFWAEYINLINEVDVPELLQKLSLLFGTINCIKCGKGFTLWEHRIRILA